jgi:hypothetical protein
MKSPKNLFERPCLSSGDLPELHLEAVQQLFQAIQSGMGKLDFLGKRRKEERRRKKGNGFLENQKGGQSSQWLLTSFRGLPFRLGISSCTRVLTT